MFINHIESHVWQAQVGIMWLVRTYGILTNWDDTLCIFLILVVVHSCEKKKNMGLRNPCLSLSVYSWTPDWNLFSLMIHQNFGQIWTWKHTQSDDSPHFKETKAAENSWRFRCEVYLIAAEACRKSRLPGSCWERIITGKLARLGFIGEHRM